MDVSAFIVDLSGVISQILLTPPVSYFLGLAILLSVIAIFKNLISWR